MNKLIKEICAREKGKSEVSVGNVRSVLKHLAEILCDDFDDKYTFEWNIYCDKVNDKLVKKRNKKSK